MAVYTEVTDEALTAFLADYDIGSVVAFRGIAEGVENSNYSLRTTAGDFILTLYEARRSGGAALVPRPDRAPGEARHRLSAAGARTRWRRPAPSVRPTCRDHDVSARCLAAAGAAGALRDRSEPRSRGCTRRRRLRDRRDAMRSGRMAGRRCWSARAARADEVQPGLAQELGTTRWAGSCGMAAGSADWPYPRRPVSRQRVLPGRQACPA